MKAAAFDYATPADVGAALAALAQGGEGAKLLGGGQSLGPMLNLRLARPSLVVDVSRTQGLAGIETRGEAIRIGAATTHAMVEDTPLPGVAGTMLRAVASNIAYRAVRNRGTVGGSLAHADPAADWPLAMAALGAVVVARGPRGERSLAVDGLMVAAYTTQLTDDELIVAVEVPALSASARWGYYKVCRKTGEFPDAAAAIVMDPEQRVARVFLGALDGPPKRLDALARQLAETAHATPDDLAAAVKGAAPDLTPARQRMQAGALARALRQVFPNLQGV